MTPVYRAEKATCPHCGKALVFVYADSDAPSAEELARLAQPIASYRWSSRRIPKALERASIRTFRDLYFVSQSELLRAGGIGKTSIKEIQKALAELEAKETPVASDEESAR